MRHDVDVELRLDCSAYGNLAYSVADKMSGICPVLLHLVCVLIPMAGDIDIFWTELHKLPDGARKSFLVHTVEWRYNLNRRKCLVAVFKYICNLHLSYALSEVVSVCLIGIGVLVFCRYIKMLIFCL